MRRTGGGLLPASIATWDRSVVRYFMVSPLGNDLNAGYIDAAAGTTFTAAQVANVPIRTLARLREILPVVGAGRTAVILLQNNAGSVFDYAEDFDLTGVSGYRYLLKRASTDLLNGDAAAAVNDRVICGYVIGQTGPNGDGSWTVAAGATTSVVPIAAGALPAEPAALGMRVRFKGNVTAALKDQCRVIAANAAGQLTLGSVSSVAAAQNDEFFIEEPGVRVTRFREIDAGSKSTLTTGASLSDFSTYMAGILTTSSELGSFAHGCVGGVAGYAGIGTTAATNNTVFSDRSESHAISISTSYLLETFGFATVGTGLRAAAGLNIRKETGASNGSALFFVRSTSTVVIRAQVSGFLGGGSYSTCNTTVENLTPPGLNRGAPIVGAQGTDQLFRQVSGTLRVGGAITLQNINIAGTGTIVLGSSGTVPTSQQSRGGFYSVNLVSGATSAAFPIDCSGLRGAIVVFNRGANASTCTGATGEILLGQSVPTTHAAFDLTAAADELGNFYTGLVADVSQAPGSMHVIRVTNNSGGAVAVGHVARKNGTARQSTTAQANTAANSEGPIGVYLTPAANGGQTLVQVSGVANVRQDAVPTIGNLNYLSEATAGVARDTPPPVAATNQKLRLGVIEGTFASGGVNYATTRLQIELFPVVSNGVAP